MESLDRLVSLMLARLETINADHGKQLDLLARSYLDKELNILPSIEVVKRIGNYLLIKFFINKNYFFIQIMFKVKVRSNLKCH